MTAAGVVAGVDEAEETEAAGEAEAAGVLDVTTVVAFADEPAAPDEAKLFDDPDATVASDATVVLALPLRIAPAFEVDCDPSPSPPPPHTTSSTRRDEDSEDKETKERETFTVKLAMSINSIRITKWICCFVESTKQAHRTRRPRAADWLADLSRTSRRGEVEALTGRFRRVFLPESRRRNRKKTGWDAAFGAP